MNVYIEMAKLPVFSVADVNKITNNVNTSYSQLNRMMKKGLIKKIRNNMYSVINPTTGLIVASKYQIASAITDTAYLSHRSALEYYGLTNQVSYEVYVSSETKFNHFEYDGIRYRYVASRIQEGVVAAKNTAGVRITDLERTVIDSIQDFNKITGLEELLNCLDGIHYLDESKLKKYLDIYNIQGLYQKVGFLLSSYQKDLQISDEFIDYCKEQTGESRRYLSSEDKDNSYYNKDWQLMVPELLLELS